LEGYTNVNDFTLKMSKENKKNTNNLGFIKRFGYFKALLSPPLGFINIKKQRGNRPLTLRF